ncbi:MAG: hypothetical protein DRQ37_04960, partial [Gammaproteobacteria bacterium]
MDEHLKQRLVGAVVLVVLAVIFVPMLLTGGSSTPAPPVTRDIATSSQEKGFSSRIIPLGLDSPVPVKAPAPVTPPKKSQASKPAPPQSPATKEPKRPVQKAPTKTATSKKAEPAKRAKDQRVGLTAWAVQLGSFSKNENAVALRARLQGSGYTASVAPSHGKSDKMARVP